MTKYIFLIALAQILDEDDLYDEYFEIIQKLDYKIASEAERSWLYIVEDELCFRHRLRLLTQQESA